MLLSCSTTRKEISKRGRNRTVSAMTPPQLARKRAKDRESQKAVRRRTKEHICRLERELEELQRGQHSSSIVQSLLRQNEVLNNEIRLLSGALRVITTKMPLWPPEYASYIEERSLRSDSRPSTSGPMVYDASPCGDNSTISGFRTYELSSHPMANQYEEEEPCDPVLDSCETWVSMAGTRSTSSSAAIVPLSVANDSTITNRSNNMAGVMLQYNGMLDETKLVDQADVELGLLLTESHVGVKGWSYDTSQGYRGPGSYLPSVPMQPLRAIDTQMHGVQTRHIFPTYMICNQLSLASTQSMGG